MANDGWWGLARGLLRIFTQGTRTSGPSDDTRTGSSAPRTAPPTRPAPRAGSPSRAPKPAPRTAPGPAAHGSATRDYPGDFTGTVRAEYSPNLDGDADPGEVVWTWVPFEEDFTQGKDRPVLVVGRDGAWLLALMLTSKDHSKDAADEARWGRRWLDLGAGPWDAAGRPSEVRLDRVLRVDPSRVRREGAILARDEFDAVVAAM